jgi:hypothetical protein
MRRLPRWIVSCLPALLLATGVIAGAQAVASARSASAPASASVAMPPTPADLATTRHAGSEPNVQGAVQTISLAVRGGGPVRISPATVVVALTPDGRSGHRFHGVVEGLTIVDPRGTLEGWVATARAEAADGVKVRIRARTDNPEAAGHNVNLRAQPAPIVVATSGGGGGTTHLDLDVAVTVGHGAVPPVVRLTFGVS